MTMKCKSTSILELMPTGNDTGNKTALLQWGRMKSTIRQCWTVVRSKIITLIVDNDIVRKSLKTLRWLKTHAMLRELIHSYHK